MLCFRKRVVALLAVVCSPPLLSAQSVAAAPTPPELQFLSPSATPQVTKLQAAYTAALHNLLVLNTISYNVDGKASEYNQAGLLAETPNTFVRAGGGYQQPWTRDASVNSWSGASLLEPAVARNTLVSVLRRQPDGRLIVQQDDQWWDQVIWIIAALNHYNVTGDRTFLTNAYQAAQSTLQADRAAHFNTQFGLFEGPAFLNDGIAGYPAPPADATESRGSFVLAYPGAAKIMVLSTNCLYAEAYHRSAEMARLLHRPAAEIAAFQQAGDSVAASIRQHLWLPTQGRFGYFLYPDGQLETSQEGAGTAFAILFGVAAPEQAGSLLRTVKTSAYGIEDVTPGFPRVPSGHPGRHSDVIWPPISAFWAQAESQQGDAPGFARATEGLATLVSHSGDTFSEIYNPQTGEPDGGWQVGEEWKSQPDQTWSATGFLRMIYAGLFGMRFDPDGLRLQPTLPAGWGDVALGNLHYRNAVLRLELHGVGHTVRRASLDGHPLSLAKLPATLAGHHTVSLEMTP